MVAGSVRGDLLPYVSHSKPLSSTRGPARRALLSRCQRVIFTTVLVNQLQMINEEDTKMTRIKKPTYTSSADVRSGVS